MRLNVIIGASYVVVHNESDGVVGAVNSIKAIMTLDEFLDKRKRNTLNEAKKYAKTIFANTGRKPTLKELDGFYTLYIKRDINEIKNNNLTIKFS